MPRINTTRALQTAKYSFDPARNAWFCGKKPVDEENVLVYLIQYAKSKDIPAAGEWAGAALTEAKTTPELTTAGFVKACMIRNRNRRIAGKYLFRNWARAVGIEITGKLEEFIARHSLLVARFYNEIAAGYECCKKQARIAGRVMRSVFIGWELRDEDAGAVDAEVRKQPPKPVTPVTQTKGEGLRRHQEFMAKLFSADLDSSSSLYSYDNLRIRHDLGRITDILLPHRTGICIPLVGEGRLCRGFRKRAHRLLQWRIWTVNAQGLMRIHPLP